MWDPYAEFESTTLPNGLEVHAAHWPGRPWQAFGILIHAGAMHDPVGLEGLAHFVEHMVSENARLSKDDIRAFFEDHGGRVDLGRTGHLHTTYRFFVPCEKVVFEQALAIMANMLLQGTLENALEREREVIVGEFHRIFPVNSKFDFMKRKNEALHAGCWLERTVRPLGHPESIRQISQTDLQGLYDTHYTPANMSIVGVGGLPFAQLVELVSRSPFGETREGSRTVQPAPLADIVPPSEARVVLNASDFSKQPLDVGGYESTAKLPGTIGTQLIRVVDSMLTVVLNEEVREKRAWTYAIASERYNHGPFYELSIECRALALSAMGSIEEVIESCVDSLGGKEELFEQIVRRARANLSLADLTGIGLCDEALKDLTYHRRIITLEEVDKELERITMADVRSVAPLLQAQRRWSLIIKP